jgi:hypothetical protein
MATVPQQLQPTETRRANNEDVGNSCEPCHRTDLEAQGKTNGLSLRNLSARMMSQWKRHGH